MFAPFYMPRPSPRAEELGRTIAEVVRTYRAEHPSTSLMDIRQSLSVATRQLQPEIGGTGRPVLFGVLAAVIGVTGFGLSILISRRDMDGATPWIMLTALVVAVIAVLAATIAHRRS
jgi:hypothetical protein